VAAAAPRKAAAAWSALRSPEVRERLRLDAELVRDLVAGKVKERYGPLVEKLARRAAQ
jgi:hypothetical protein